MTPRVSVIIPAYNGDRFITQAIESVLAQTYTNYEIIVVDDGSTDNTHQVLQPYFDRIRYVIQNNQGVAVARNRGIEVSQGDLIAFLDQDDLFLPDKLAVQVQCFEEHPELGLVNSGWANVAENGDLLANVEAWHDLPELNIEAWIVWKPVFPGALMVRRSWLLQIGGFNAQFQQTSDVDLCLRLALIGCKSDWIKEVTVCYRQHEKNTSRNVMQQVQELDVLLDEFFYRSDLPNEARKLEQGAKYQSLIWSAWRLYQTNNFDEMMNYLEHAHQNKDGDRVKLILEWIEAFKRYSSEYGIKLDICQLLHLKEWQIITKKMLSPTIGN